jgi:alpha-galactosidase/6-phospho-beta-glucosidase family protein
MMYIIGCEYVICRASAHRLRATGLDTHVTNKYGSRGNTYLQNLLMVSTIVLNIRLEQ